MTNPYLQPLSVGQILAGALRLYKENLAVLVTVALIPHLLLLAFEYLLQLAKLAPETELAVSLVVGSVVTAAALALVTAAVLRAVLGEEPGVALAYAQATQANLLGVVGAYLLSSLVIIMGFFMLILPGLVAGGLFATVIPAIMVERRRAIEGLRRSVALIRGDLPKGMAVFAYFLLVTNLLPMLVFLVQASAGMGPFTPLLFAIIGAITLPLGFSANVLLYLSLRTSEIGYGPDKLLAELRGAAGA